MLMDYSFLKKNSNCCFGLLDVVKGFSLDLMRSSDKRILVDPESTMGPKFPKINKKCNCSKNFANCKKNSRMEEWKKNIDTFWQHLFSYMSIFGLQCFSAQLLSKLKSDFFRAFTFLRKSDGNKFYVWTRHLPTLTHQKTEMSLQCQNLWLNYISLYKNPISRIS